MKIESGCGGHLPSQRPLETYVEPFLRYLGEAGYAERSLRKKRSVARAFSRWAQEQQIPMHDLRESHVRTFLARFGRRRAYVKLARSTLKLFVAYLHAEAGVTMAPAVDSTSPTSDLVRRYAEYLRRDRGLSERSIQVYVPFVRDFLESRPASNARRSPALLDPNAIRDYLLSRARNRSSESSRLLATVLRSLCRFLFFDGQMTADLSSAVPSVRKWRQSSVPAILSAEQVERVLSSTDRSTATGRRDHAILLLLARLGLRAGEVVRLELGDIRWRTGEIVIRGKGRMLDHLPVPADVGKALATYLKQDRGSTTSRRVFVRRFAPRTGLATAVAVGHIARRALARAGVIRSGRGAAHLFRHGLATRMIRHGASMREIAEVLRHRSQNNTAIYAKVSFDALRGVALPWPISGGMR